MEREEEGTKEKTRNAQKEEQKAERMWIAYVHPDQGRALVTGRARRDTRTQTDTGTLDGMQSRIQTRQHTEKTDTVKFLPYA